MKREIVRLQKVELRNLKNVGYGAVKFVSKNSAASDILGLYGQNGSGKTTLVYAIDVLKNLLMGKSLVQDLGNYIKIGESTAGATVEFFVTSSEDDLYKIIYEFVLERKVVDVDEHIEENDDIDEEEHEKRNGAYLVSEKVSMARSVNGKWTKMTPILYYNASSNEILPKNRYNLLTKGKQELIDELRVLRLLTVKEERSFLFSKELRKIIRDSKWEDEYKFIFKVLTEYAIYNLHVFSSEDTGMINANIALPFSIVSKEKDRISLLKGCLNLNGVSPIPRKFFGDIQVISQ
jgi:AAA15 family ATPase/GTPase